MNYTLEERAKLKAREIAEDLGINSNPKSLEKLEKLYIRISKEALEKQWISVEDKLPDPNERVLCFMKSTWQVVSGYIDKHPKGFARVSTDPNFEFEDWEDYECTHWMPEPSSPVDDSEEPIERKNFCNQGQSIILSRLGFREKCFYHYNPWFKDPIPNHGEDNKSLVEESWNSKVSFNRIDAPLLHQAQGWLRENKKYSVEPSSTCSVLWGYSINNLQENELLDTEGVFDTYEEALSAGITEVLKILCKDNKEWIKDLSLA